MTLTAIAFLVVQQAAPVVTVPMREEPFHRPVYENDRVAVYDVVLPLAAVMRYHEHPTNHLAVVIDSGRMWNEVVGRPGRVNPTGPRGTIVYLPAGPPHRQTNIGQTTVRFIAVEVLGPVAKEAGPPVAGKEQRARPDATSGCRVAVNAVDIRAWRCRVPPGDAAPRRSMSGPFLRVGLSPGRLDEGDAPGRGAPEELAPGTAVWHETSPGAAPRNAGSSTVEFVDLEWK